MSNSGSTPKSPLGFDEIIAIFVAFSTLGTIFILSFPSTERGLNIFENRTTSPTSESPSSTPQTPQNPLNPSVNPGQVPSLLPGSTNPATSPQDNSTPISGNPGAWGGLALPFLAPNPTNAEATPTPANERTTLSSPTNEETTPRESLETPVPNLAPSATPKTQATTDSTPKP